MTRQAALAILLLTLAACGREAEENGEGGLRSAVERTERNAAVAEAKAETPVAAPAERAEESQGGVDARSPANPGTAQRRAILDALRPAVEARLGPNVEFVVDRISVAPGWALVFANPQRRGGAPIDGRAIFGDDIDNMDGLTVTAILRFQGGRWNLVDHAIGATDVWYCDGRIGAPSSLTGC